MDSLFDQGDDLPVGGGARPDTGTEQPEVTPKPVSPLSEEEWLSCSQENPSLLRKLKAKAFYNFPGKSIQKRRDALQECLEKLQDLAVEKKASSPMENFDPIKEAKHAFGRVMRHSKAEKRGGRARMLSLSGLSESWRHSPVAKPSVHEHQVEAVREAALKKLLPREQKIICEWKKAGCSITHQKLAKICGCTRKNVADVLSLFEQTFVEAMNNSTIF